MWQELSKKIVWLGHDAFRIDGSKTVYFDPYNIPPGPKGDLILISHEHYDHCSPEDVAKIQHEGTVIVTTEDTAKKLSGDVRMLAPGESLVVDDIKIKAVSAYNTDKDFHPKNKGWLGFVLEMDGARLYYAGDTDFIPEMKDLEVDIALLPVSGTYVMTAEQAVEAARAINPKLAIPMHYGTIVGDENDAIAFKKALKGQVEVRVLSKS